DRHEIAGTNPNRLREPFQDILRHDADIRGVAPEIFEAEKTETILVGAHAFDVPLQAPIGWYGGVGARADLRVRRVDRDALHRERGDDWCRKRRAPHEPSQSVALVLVETVQRFVHTFIFFDHLSHPLVLKIRSHSYHSKR